MALNTILEIQLRMYLTNDSLRKLIYFLLRKQTILLFCEVILFSNLYYFQNNNSEEYIPNL